MTDYQQLKQTFEKALKLSIDNSSKMVFMSDIHRGDGSGADNFRKNKNIMITALRYYDRNRFTLFELGDGDELWANEDFDRIAKANVGVFSILTSFYEDNRYFPLYGNHDMVKRNEKWVDKNLDHYQLEYNDRVLPLFPRISVNEAFVLTHSDTNDQIFLLHGHQVDIANDDLWRISRFLIRYLWRPLEILGMQNPTSPVNNATRKQHIEQTLVDFTLNEKVMIIAGHTHRTVFPKVCETMYFNDGCCVYPHFITTIELENGLISLVKWSIVADERGVLTIVREVLKGPNVLLDYFKATCTCKTAASDNDNFRF